MRIGIVVSEFNFDICMMMLEQAQEHAKFLVHATSESYQCSVPELARLVRLAHSVKKRIWMGVVDSEGDVTYLQVIRVTP